MLYPPAKIVRICKIAIILLPLLTFIFGVLFLAVQYGDSPRSKTKGRKMTFEEIVEGSGICFNMGLVKLPNDSYVENTQVDYSQTNKTVLNHCKWYLETLETYYRPKPEKINPYKHTFLIDGKTICREDTDVIILVHSRHDYVDKRTAIRDTWGYAATNSRQWPGGARILKNIELVFVFGMHKNKSWDAVIKKESDDHQDIIQGDFMEDYHNMTLKSLLGLKWVREYCPSAKYLVKSDDDMIINIPYLLSELDSMNFTRSIMGPYNEGSRVYRRGKWKISKDEYPFAHYPPYESGSAYIINTDLVKDLYDMSEYIPHIFIDDVYITGIVGKAVGANHIKHSGFAFWTDKRPKPCYLLRNFIVTGTKMKPQLLNTLWMEMHTTNIESCPKEMPT